MYRLDDDQIRDEMSKKVGLFIKNDAKQTIIVIVEQLLKIELNWDRPFSNELPFLSHLIVWHLNFEIKQNIISSRLIQNKLRLKK